MDILNASAGDLSAADVEYFLLKIDKIIDATLKKTDSKMSIERAKRILKFLLTHAETLALVEKAMDDDEEKEKASLTSLEEMEIGVREISSTEIDKRPAVEEPKSTEKSDTHLIPNSGNSKAEISNDDNGNLKAEISDDDNIKDEAPLHTIKTDSKRNYSRQLSLPVFCLKDQNQDVRDFHSTLCMDDMQSPKYSDCYVNSELPRKKNYPKINFRDMSNKRKRSDSPEPSKDTKEFDDSYKKVIGENGSERPHFKPCQENTPSFVSADKDRGNDTKVEDESESPAKISSKDHESMADNPLFPIIDDYCLNSMDYDEINLKGGVQTPGKNLDFNELDQDDIAAEQEVINAVSHLNDPIFPIENEISVRENRMLCVPKRTPEKPKENPILKKGEPTHNADYQSGKDSNQNSVSEQLIEKQKEDLAEINKTVQPSNVGLQSKKAACQYTAFEFTAKNRKEEIVGQDEKNVASNYTGNRNEKEAYQNSDSEQAAEKQEEDSNESEKSAQSSNIGHRSRKEAYHNSISEHTTEKLKDNPAVKSDNAIESNNAGYQNSEQLTKKQKEDPDKNKKSTQSSNVDHQSRKEAHQHLISEHVTEKRKDQAIKNYKMTGSNNTGYRSNNKNPVSEQSTKNQKEDHEESNETAQSSSVVHQSRKEAHQHSISEHITEKFKDDPAAKTEQAIERSKSGYRSGTDRYQNLVSEHSIKRQTENIAKDTVKSFVTAQSSNASDQSRNNTYQNTISEHMTNKCKEDPTVSDTTIVSNNSIFGSRNATYHKSFSEFSPIKQKDDLPVKSNKTFQSNAYRNESGYRNDSGQNVQSPNNSGYSGQSRREAYRNPVPECSTKQQSDYSEASDFETGIEWSREQDKHILLVCKKLGTTEGAFRLAAKFVGVSEVSIVKNRFQELMTEIRKKLKNKPSS